MEKKEFKELIKTNGDRQLITSIVRTANTIVEERRGEADYLVIPEENIRKMAIVYGISEEKVCEILREYFIPKHT